MPSKQRLNALIMVYSKCNRPLDAEKVLREMQRDGLKPDVVCYTTVIDAYKRVRNYDKCWELFSTWRHGMVVQGQHNVDEFLLSLMIRICAFTHDSEKAIKLFSEMETRGFIEYCAPYNSIIFALASTKRYADKAIEYWQQMHIKKIMPDRHTIVAVLKACSQLGDVATAYDVL